MRHWQNSIIFAQTVIQWSRTINFYVNLDDLMSIKKKKKEISETCIDLVAKENAIKKGGSNFLPFIIIDCYITLVHHAHRLKLNKKKIALFCVVCQTGSSSHNKQIPIPIQCQTHFRLLQILFSFFLLLLCQIN